MRNSKKNILFTSIIGPYGVDSDRSRFKNPMSLLSNQVTRGQKYYTVQMCQRTFAFDLFGVNLDANVAALNFPLEEHLRAVINAGKWDRVGIASIVSNFESLLATYQVIRNANPDIPIDIGGYIANDDEVIKELISRILKLTPSEKFDVWRSDCEDQILSKDPADINNWLKEAKLHGKGVTFVKRDGLEYYAQLDGVGLKSNEAIFAPLIDASFGKRVMGLPVPQTSSGLIIPDVGCPMKCHFCATSHKFDGKFLHFLSSAEDIMAVANAQADRGVSDFFVMSENFSLDTARLLKLLELMEEQKRPYKFELFSSANGLIKLGVENIVKLGSSFIWIGLEESTGTTFSKTHEIDLKDLVKSLQDYGVTVLGSTILGFENQTMEDLDREVDYALSYSCVYNQFMLYMPSPGTALWSSMKERGLLKKNFLWLDGHGQSIQNWNNSFISDEKMEKRLDRAFEQDFEILGPSLYRMMKVHYDGYMKTKDWDHELVQMRRLKMKEKFMIYAPLLGAMYHDLKRMNHVKASEVKKLKEAIMQELSFKAKIKAKLLEPVIHITLRMEKRRYNESQKNRRVKDPPCSITNYGDFSWEIPPIISGVIKAPGSVAVPRSHKNQLEILKS